MEGTLALLISQTELETHSVEAWHQDVLDDIRARLSSPSDFPCTFSQNAFRRRLVQFAFVDAPGTAGFDQGATALTQYAAESRNWDGRVDSAKPLLMVFGPGTVAGNKLDDYHAHGWQALHHWMATDPTPWPETVAPNPQDPFWSFCFDGLQLFVNMSAPAHVTRKSRNLGRYLTLVINPRERFDIVAGDTPEGQRTRARIRARAEAYDGIPHSPRLGSYQKGELEWVQYALPDDNDTPLGSCPLHARDQAT
ncbi:YqcI/YcgG family protein [Alisedimentitalea sp. MJ-SS2]|uniref:YqcI/YcgG family protein n=1 Tax=Aliisedimentitalea sp. MJ-SS2 TaxID=3049795 RepID=UPI0029069892|nr:YqcI/YcgG family protein [Alisedimentitalea sp. MJ-SS2]MDU8927292.1 YqcI/YcgG family protein [Alisedimentitalea sp. MJ-SS2]